MKIEACAGSLFDDHTKRETNIISTLITEPQFVSTAQEDRIVVDLKNAQIQTVTNSHIDSSANRQREVRRTCCIRTTEAGNFQFCVRVSNASEGSHKRRDSAVAAEFILWSTKHVEDANVSLDITSQGIS